LRSLLAFARYRSIPRDIGSKSHDFYAKPLDLLANLAEIAAITADFPSRMSHRVTSGIVQFRTAFARFRAKIV
jgi:hypothetical protein